MSQLLHEQQSQLEASDESAAEDSHLNNKHQVLATSDLKKEKEKDAVNVADCRVFQKSYSEILHCDLQPESFTHYQMCSDLQNITQ